MCLSHHLSQVHKDHSVPVQCSPVTSDCTALPYENNSAAAAARHPELQAGWGVRETVPHNLLTSITSDAVITKALWLHVQMELKQEMDKKSERKKRQQGKKKKRKTFNHFLSQHICIQTPVCTCCCALGLSLALENAAF